MGVEAQEYNIALVLLTDGSVLVQSSIAAASVNYPRLRVVAKVGGNLTEAAIEDRVAQALLKANITWLRRGVSERQWLIDLSMLRNRTRELESEEWCNGRVKIKQFHQHDVNFDRARGQIEHECIIEWIHPWEDDEAKVMKPPPELTSFIDAFHLEHPQPEKCAFVMMRFQNTKWHIDCFEAIEAALAAHGFKALRADQRSYSEDLFSNIRTYMYACGLGVAVFERVTTEDFNPNVSLEVGYMIALGKPVCLLKDQNLKALHTDLVGRLYRSLDPQNLSESITKEITAWLEDKRLI